MTERLLRIVAVAIAIAALIDPSVTIAGRVRPRISVVVQRGPSMILPSGSDRTRTRAAEAARVVTALKSALHADLAFVNGFDPAADAIVVVGDRFPLEPMPDAARVSTIDVGGPLSPNVAIVDIEAPRSVPPATSIHIAVRVTGSGVRGATSVLVARSGGVEVGRATQVWTRDEEVWSASLLAVPVGQPPFIFDLSIDPLPAERTGEDNAARVRVEPADRMRVFVYEARPSWSTSFVRRALEDDPRFEVAGISQASPRARVATGSGPRSEDWADALDGFDVVLVGGLETLPASVLPTIDRFIRERGGGAVILPDARIPATVMNGLIGNVPLREVLLERPSALGGDAQPQLSASELLEAERLPPGADVLARAPASARPVIWSVPKGDGRLLVSGAMDAWRYRADPQRSFERFWRSTTAGLAIAARRPVDLVFTPERAAVGERVTATARIRSRGTDRAGERLAVSARANGSAFRLWPEARTGVFSGSFLMTDEQAAVEITATTPDRTLSAARTLTADNHAREATAPPLSLLASTHRGVNVVPSDLATVTRHLRTTTAARSEPAPRRMMRSTWWLGLFAACLSGEWWLRRKRGAR
jgi:hypothetical protein